MRADGTRHRFFWVGDPLAVATGRHSAFVVCRGIEIVLHHFPHYLGIDDPIFMADAKPTCRM